MNGFGRYIFIDNQFELFNLFSYDVDGDGIVDIGGLDESGKNLFIYYGKGFNKFTQPIKYSLGFKYSGLVVKKLNLDRRTNLILFSKVDGLFKIYSFNGRIISATMTFKVDCCFTDVNIVNLDKSPELEIVLSGANFKGLGIITFKSYQYTYKKIKSEEDSFSKLVPIFLNRDDRIDLVGFNSLKKELVLLRNNSIYNYSKSVYKKFDESINEILTGNFDDDLINDLVLISNGTNSLYVFFGNGLGSFSSSKELKTNSNYSSSIVFDYNKDLLDDFFIYDKFNKNLCLKTLSSDYENILYQPLIDLEKLFSLINYKTTNTRGIVVSSNQGLFLIVYSNLSFTSEKFSLSPKPVDLTTVRLEDELFPRILFLDNKTRRLNILSRNEFNAPQEILIFPISYPYERIKILSFNKNEITLVCFKPTLYHFDYFRINLKSGKYVREILTVDGLIVDIGLEKTIKDQILINVIIQADENLRTILINPFAVNKIILNEKIASLNVSDYVFDYSNRELIYLDRYSKFGDIQLILKKFDASYKSFETFYLNSIRDENYLSANISLCNNLSNLRVVFVNLVRQNEAKLLIMPINKSGDYFLLDKIKISDMNSCKCKDHTSFSLKTFSFFNEINKSIEKIIVQSKGKPVNSPLKELPFNTVYSIDYSLKLKPEIVYISNYSIINIEVIKE